MIPRDHFHDNGDGAALWVTDNALNLALVYLFATPCDTCGGTGHFVDDRGEVYEDTCDDCDGSGRHTFDIEVGRGFASTAVRDLVDGVAVKEASRIPRVHVIDVLPIKLAMDGSVPETEPCVWIYSGVNARLRHPVIEHEMNWEPITLPPAAAPGMWLVRLAVHT